MDLLENDLVRRYFDGGIADLGKSTNLAATAFNVILAMQQPIKKGERYLEYMPHSYEWEEGNRALDEGWHPDRLRLPDRFQGHPKMIMPQFDGKIDYQCQCGAEFHFGADGVMSIKPEPPKCPCGIACSNICNCICHAKQRTEPKPDEVEGKIYAFLNVWVPRGTHDKAKISLRELVSLARKR